MLDTGAQRQFRPGPCPPRVHGPAREQTMYNPGAGPDSTPISNYLSPQVGPPTTEKAKGSRRRNRGPQIAKWGDGTKRTEGDRLAQTGPGPVTPSHNPATTGRAGKALLLRPDFFMPAQFHFPQLLTREISSEVNPPPATWFLTYIGAWTLLQHQKLQPPGSFYWGYSLPERTRPLGETALIIDMQHSSRLLSTYHQRARPTLNPTTSFIPCQRHKQIMGHEYMLLDKPTERQVYGLSPLYR